jgi:predicted AAA+ superfamily ATPase
MVERKLLQQLIAHCHRKEITIVAGARQTGKTTLLKQLREHLISEGNDTFYMTLENMLVLTELNVDPENLFKFVQKPKQQRIYVLIDEIQYLDNPTNFLKLLYDNYSDILKLIVTGSSGFYIDVKFKDSLAGRKRMYEIYTLDFEEYLEFAGVGELVQDLSNIRADRNFQSLNRAELLMHFSDYLIYGGYPAVVLEPNRKEKKELLKELVSSYLKRDILESGVQYSDKFMKLLVILSHQSASLLNVNELANTLGLSVSAVNNYLYVLEKSYHINLAKPYFNNVRKELTKMPKVFFNDLGMRNTLMNNFNATDLRQDRGTIVENYTYIRLRQLYGKDDIRFWRTADGNEIDFIYSDGEVQFALEVKYNEIEFALSKYKKFIQNYPSIPLRCVALISSSNETNVLGL